MHIPDINMAADTQRFMDSPLVKAGIKLAQSIAGAAVIGLCSSGLAKLDGIQTSINGFSKDIALVQRDQSMFKATLDALVKDMSDQQKTVLRQGFDIGQLRKELDARGH